jgi:hypothetical protein
MKKLNLLLLAAILLTACGSASQAVINSWAEAMNAGDMDKVLSYLAEDAVVTIIPAMEGDGVYNGHAEIRGWYEPLFAGKGVSTLSGCVVNGETVTCLNTYIDEGLKSMGVDFIEGDFVAVVRDGKIQSYTLTITPESLAKFPPPPTPAPIISEVRITSEDAIVGKWVGEYDGEPLQVEFVADHSMVVRWVGVDGPPISVDPIKFEDDLLVTETEGCGTGSYEVYATYEGDKVVKLRFVLIGEDACEEREGTMAGKTFLPAAP